MKLLAFETSSDVGSVALTDGEAVWEDCIETPRQQTARLLPLAQELLAEAGFEFGDLDGVTFGRGPGSFTGLRVAAAAAQGLALASGVPLFPVSSLAVTAQGLWRTRGAQACLVCVDAHMAEVFWGSFETNQGLARPVGPERLTEPAAVTWESGPEWIAAGNGFAVYETVLGPVAAAAETIVADARPQARDLFPQASVDYANARGEPPENATPVYLRSEAAWQK